MNTNEFNNLIDSLKHSSTLNLSDKSYTSQQIDHLCLLIQSINEIHKIYLANSKLKDEGIEKIVIALINRGKPISISLYNNDITSQTFGCIASGLTKGIFIDLDLGANMISKENLEVFINALAINNNLESLDIGLNVLEPIYLKLILNGIKKHPTLSALYLGYSQINDELCINIMDTIEGSKIHKINLMSNYITHKGAEKIAKSLEKNHQLQEIDLRSNNIGEEGKIALKKSMKMNFVIINLKFDEDEIIAPYLARNQLLIQSALYKAIQHYLKASKDDLINPITAKDLFILKTHQNLIIKTLKEYSISFEDFQKAIYNNYNLLNLPKIKGWCKNIIDLGNFNILPREIKNYIFSFLGDEYLYPAYKILPEIETPNIFHKNHINFIGNVEENRLDT